MGNKRICNAADAYALLAGCCVISSFWLHAKNQLPCHCLYSHTYKYTRSIWWSCNIPHLCTLCIFFNSKSKYGKPYQLSISMSPFHICIVTNLLPSSTDILLCKRYPSFPRCIQFISAFTYEIHLYKFMLTIWEWKQGASFMINLSFYFESWHDLSCYNFCNEWWYIGKSLIWQYIQQAKILMALAVCQVETV